MRVVEDCVYRIGEAEINLATRTVRRNREVIRLRPKSFGVLSVLIEHRHRVVTKEELFREVWPNVSVTENSLVKCISELRRALGDDLKEPRYVQSVPTVGYQLAGVVEAEPTSEPKVAPPPRPRRPRMIAVGLATAAILALFGVYRWATGSRTAAQPSAWHWQEIAWWKLDEGQGTIAHDSAAHHLAGALSAGVVWPPERDAGLRFTGLDAAITGHDRGVLPNGHHARTITAWIKIDGPNVDATSIFSYGVYQRAPTNRYLSAGLDLDARFGFGIGLQRDSLKGVRRLDNAWHMATVTYESPPSGKAGIFIDGQLDQTGALPDPPETAAESDWRIGQFVPGLTTFRGNIKDVRVFDRALTESQIAGLYACTSAEKDLADYYYLPVMLHGFVREPRAPADPSAPMRNRNLDFGGMQFALVHGGCAMTSVEGADAGQDLRMSMDVQVPTDAAGHITQAGPYFRSRSAGPGDGLMGGRSAGYWVQLHSNGMLKVRRLNPLAVVAFTTPIQGFDSAAFHRLAMEARGATLQVWLDGALVQFDQGGRTVDRVDIPAAWETPERIGDNQGAAGVAFGSEDNRGKIGGQRVRNLALERLR